MAEKILSIFISPPIAFARLGSSSVPQDAYSWVRSSDPRSDGETTIEPSWSLRVSLDGSIEAFKPTEISFVDNSGNVRPVAPFFEFWARVGEPGGATREVPLTQALLTQHSAGLKVSVEAHNLKAARRTRNPNLGFGTQQPVTISASTHAPTALLGSSPRSATTPMVPRDRNIPLGSVQITQSMPQPADVPVAEVNLATIRLRLTPAKGLFYGPPSTIGTGVGPEQGFLSSDAGWANAEIDSPVQPSDTYAGAENADGRSRGIVDDTCEVRFEATLTLAGGAQSLTARATAFVGPPDFAPDRRPFLSVADELNDRMQDAADRNAQTMGADRDAWVEDLFERIYETVSLLNVDRYQGLAITLPPDQLRAVDLDQGQRLPNNIAMGGRDPIRDEDYSIAPATTNNPLPLSEHAKTRHRALSDLQNLKLLVALQPNSAAISDPAGVSGRGERGTGGGTKEFCFHKHAHAALHAQFEQRSADPFGLAVRAAHEMGR